MSWRRRYQDEGEQVQGQFHAGLPGQGGEVDDEVVDLRPETYGGVVEGVADQPHGGS